MFYPDILLSNFVIYVVVYAWSYTTCHFQIRPKSGIMFNSIEFCWKHYLFPTKEESENANQWACPSKDQILFRSTSHLYQIFHIRFYYWILYTTITYKNLIRMWCRSEHNLILTWTGSILFKVLMQQQRNSLTQTIEYPRNLRPASFLTPIFTHSVCPVLPLGLCYG